MSRIVLTAGMEWARNPTGPSLPDIIERLRHEAIATGELDPIKPHEASK